MVPYFGNHSCKMFIRSKPVRFVVYVDQMVIHIIFHIHRKNRDSSGPLGSRVVNEKVDVIAEQSDCLKHELFFDNFFTS